jgi:hypothetical protein
VFHLRNYSNAFGLDLLIEHFKLSGEFEYVLYRFNVERAYTKFEVRKMGISVRTVSSIIRKIGAFEEPEMQMCT